jgi:hypothetical protein
MSAITFLSVDRLDSTRLSSLWGDDVENASGRQLKKLLVIVTDREDSPHPGPQQRLNAYGIDPKRTEPTEFVFQAALMRDQLAAFLKSVVDCDESPPGLLTWIPTVIQVSAGTPLPPTGGTICTVVISNGDPPTTGPKMTALFDYADAFIECENTPVSPTGESVLQAPRGGSSSGPANDETSLAPRPGGKTAHGSR